MVKRGKVRDINDIIKDEPNNPVSHTPRIQVSQFPHPNAPRRSMESLISNTSTDNLKVEGINNPVFSIETVTEAPSSSSTGKGDQVFNFSDEEIQFYSRQNQSHKQLLSPRRRQSYAHEKNGLTVPDVSNSRRPSDPLLLGRDDHLSSLAPLSNVTSQSLSDGRFPPPSPQFLNERFAPPSPGLLSTNSAWSELAKIHSRRSSFGDNYESRTNSNSLSNVSSSLSEHLHNLVRAFSSRTERVKESTIQPPTPSSLSDYDANSDANSAISAIDEPSQRQHRINSFIPSHLRSELPQETDESDNDVLAVGCCKSRIPSWWKRFRFPNILEPQSKIYMSWLFLVTICFMYNAWAIPLRGVFPYQTPKNLVYWLMCDYFSDAVYILDILVFKPRLTYLTSGLAETDQKLTRKNYMKKRMFKFDLLSLLPLDILYLVVGFVPWLRCCRVLKIQTFWEFYQRCDQAVRSAHVLRIIKTMTYMLFLIHVETCGYYAMSVYEGIGSNRWVYNGEGVAYIRCLYLATKTATSIGNNPKPTNTLEYIFMTIYWVSGVFVFALLIGQIRDIADAAGHVKSMYQKRMDSALRYIKHLNVPQDTLDRVRTWFVFHWQQQKIIDERSVMDKLPKNLRTDLAIHVHFNTLSKVKLFQDCDKSLLFDLVLKLKPMLYLPGEYVCKKGEIGKEMYIVSQGQVEVVGGPDNTLVLATLREGSVFGEISLLAMAAEGNRRTADVKCKGFTNLFSLSKGDFEDAMAEYPEASKLLKKRARKLLRQNAKLQKESDESLGSSKITSSIIPSPQRGSSTPKLLKTVLQLMDPDSTVAKRLSNSHHRSSEDTINTQNSLDSKADDLEQRKGLPNDEEVEEFYDEMLRTELMDQETYQAAEEEMVNLVAKTQLLRDDTVNTEQSEASTDSGVQMTKATSPPGSTNKTSGNKDSKESFISNELTDIFEETCTWVIKQALNKQTAPQDEQTNKNASSEPKPELLGEFFKDPIETNISGSFNGGESTNKDTINEQQRNCDDSTTKDTNSDSKIKEDNSDSIQDSKNIVDKTLPMQSVADNKTDMTGSKSGKDNSDATMTNQEIVKDEVFDGNNDKNSENCDKNENVKDVKSEVDIKFLKRNKRISSSSITCAPIESENNMLLNSYTSADLLNSKQAPPQTENSQDVQMNGIPLQNQIICSAEVHREKSRTPSSLADWLDGNNQSRKESSTSVAKETTLLESSV